MDRLENGQEPLSDLTEAKVRLIDEAPSPADVLVRDPQELIRKHPREAVAIAAAVGVVLGASPKARRAVIDAAVSIAKILMK